MREQARGYTALGDERVLGTGARRKDERDKKREELGELISSSRVQSPMWKIIILVTMGIISARTSDAWAEAPASQPAATQAAVSSKPAEWEGLQVTVTLPKATMSADEALAFVVRFKNVSHKPFTLCNANHLWSWNTQFTDVKDGMPWTLRELFGNDRIAESLNSLKPDEILEVPVKLGGKDRFDFGVWGGAQKVTPIPHLKAGKYRLTVEISLRETQVTKEVAPFWIGTIKTAPLDLEITDKPTTRPAR
jgi:hypothetical protein